MIIIMNGHIIIHMENYKHHYVLLISFVLMLFFYFLLMYSGLPNLDRFFWIAFPKKPEIQLFWIAWFWIAFSEKFSEFLQLVHLLRYRVRIHPWLTKQLAKTATEIILGSKNTFCGCISKHQTLATVLKYSFIFYLIA